MALLHLGLSHQLTSAKYTKHDSSLRQLPLNKVHAKDKKNKMMEKRPDSGKHLAQQLPAGDTQEMYQQNLDSHSGIGTDFQ